MVKVRAEADSPGELHQILFASGSDQLPESHFDQLALRPRAGETESLAEELIVQDHVRSHRLSMYGGMRILTSSRTLSGHCQESNPYNFTRHHSSDHGRRDIWSEGLPPACTAKPSLKFTPNPFSGS